MFSDVTLRTQGASTTGAAVAAKKVVGAVRQRDDEDTIMHHVGSDSYLGGSPQGISSSIAKRSRAEEADVIQQHQTPVRTDKEVVRDVSSVGPLGNFGSLSPFLSDPADPSPSVNNSGGRSSTQTVMRPSAAMDMEFGAMLRFDDVVVASRGPVKLEGVDITYVTSSASLLSLVVNRSCSATHAPHFAVICVDTPDLSASIDMVSTILESSMISEEDIKRALSTLTTATNGLIAPSMFKLSTSSTTCHRLSSLHAVPIVLCSLAEDPTFAACISSLGSLSPYLSKYFTTTSINTHQYGSHVPSGTPSIIDGLVLEKGDSVPNLVESEQFGALFSWIKNGNNRVNGGTLQRVTQKPRLSSYGIVQSMTLAAPIHSLDELRRVVLTSSTPFTVVYFGASWCPPCLRILKELPFMLTGLPPSLPPHNLPAASGDNIDVDTTGDSTTFPSSANVVGSLLKADYDTSTEVLEAFGVERIPTFIVIDGCKIREEAATTTADGANETVVVGAAVGMLQNSKRDEVAAFVRDATNTTITGSITDAAEEEEVAVAVVDNENVFTLDADF